MAPTLKPWKQAASGRSRLDAILPEVEATSSEKEKYV